MFLPSVSVVRFKNVIKSMCKLASDQFYKYFHIYSLQQKTAFMYAFDFFF